MQNVAFCYCCCLPALTQEFTSVPDTKLVKCYIWSRVQFGAETWELRKVAHKFLESFETWRCERMEKISWSDRVKDEKVLHKSQGGNEYPTHNKQRKANWIGRILTRNCILKYVMEVQLEGTGRREITCKLEEEAQDYTL